MRTEAHGEVAQARGDSMRIQAVEQWQPLLSDVSLKEIASNAQFKADDPKPAPDKPKSRDDNDALSLSALWPFIPWPFSSISK